MRFHSRIRTPYGRIPSPHCYTTQTCPENNTEKTSLRCPRRQAGRGQSLQGQQGEAGYLNWCGLLVAQSTAGFQQGLGQLELIEGGGRELGALWCRSKVAWPCCTRARSLLAGTEFCAFQKLHTRNQAFCQSGLLPVEWKTYLAAAGITCFADLYAKSARTRKAVLCYLPAAVNDPLAGLRLKERLTADRSCMLTLLLSRLSAEAFSAAWPALTCALFSARLCEMGTAGARFTIRFSYLLHAR